MGNMPWTGLAFEGTGGCPLEQFLREFEAANSQALIVRKAEHLVEMVTTGGVECLKRPRVDTLEGPIKEIQANKQIRIIFSVFQAERVVLFLGGWVKKNGKVPTAVIAKAKAYREEWLKTRRARPLELVLQEEKGEQNHETQ